MLTDIQNRANAGVIQSGSSSSFLLKSLQGVTILAEPIQEEFHRDESAKSDILRLVDNTHTPDANSSENPIMRNCLADHTESASARNDDRGQYISCKESQNARQRGVLETVATLYF